jgi:hypothetical protein
VGYIWTQIQKDALYAQYIDSDFGAGNSDSEGGVVKAAYAPAKNWTVNGTYFLNKTNIDKAATIGSASVFNRDYKRLQLDLNFKF